MTLRLQVRLEEAEAALRSAVDFNHEYVMALNNLGIVLKEQGCAVEAEDMLRRAVAIRPNFMEAHEILGAALLAQGKEPEAVACFNTVIATEPHRVSAHWNRALAYLSSGDYRRGFLDYEWRFKNDATLQRHFDQPRRDGSSLEGRTVLLYAEQGLGDGLMFARFAPLVAARGGRVIIQCLPALSRLMKSVRGVHEVIVTGDIPPPFDVQAPLISLPLILELHRSGLPRDVPYVELDDYAREQVERLVPAAPPMRVGINWQGNPQFKEDRLRSIPLSYFLPLAEIQGVQLMSLQNGAGHEQLTESGRGAGIVDLGAELDRLDAASSQRGREAPRMALAAAALVALDLVITSDTMIAHLAGALGRPVWLVTSASPDWRWRYAGDWYPTMRQFPQARPGDWGSAFEAVATALRQRINPGAISMFPEITTVPLEVE